MQRNYTTTLGSTTVTLVMDTKEGLSDKQSKLVAEITARLARGLAELNEIIPERT